MLENVLDDLTVGEMAYQKVDLLDNMSAQMMDIVMD